MSATGCGEHRERGACLEVGRVLRTREGICRVDVCWFELQRTSANRCCELFVACILVQRHEAAIKEGVMRFHLCFVSSEILPFLCFCTDTLCSWNDGSILSRFLMRKHCRVGAFIRIDFLSTFCCAARILFDPSRLD